MRHVRKEGTNQKVIITLHGTGGSATDLFQIAQFIDPNATLIGLQGEVLERGMARYFERNNDGSFNLRSLSKATYDLKDTIEEVIKQHQLENHEITILGYSNGANLTLSYLKEFEETPIHKAILFHPSSTRMDETVKPHSRLKVLLTSGANDPYISEVQFNELNDQFLDAKIDTITYHHPYGHQLIQDELIKAKEFYE